MTTQTTATVTPDLPQAARLHLARYLAGMEMQELAAATGISRGTIRNYESLDWARPRNAAYIRLWALATGMPYDWLMGGVPQPGDGVRQFNRRFGLSTGSEATVHFLPAAVQQRAAAIPAKRTA